MKGMIVKTNKKAGLAAGLLAAVTVLIAPAAFASQTLSANGTTSPAGPVAIFGELPPGTYFSFVSDFGLPITCITPAMSGTMLRGATVAAGHQIGAISSLDFSQSTNLCDMSGLHYPLTVQKSTRAGAPATWGVFVKSTPVKGAITVPIEIRNVIIAIHSTNTVGSWACDMEGRGTIPGVFNQSTQQVTITANTGVYPLDITTFDGTKTNTVGDGITCGGEIYDTDFFQLSGTFNLISSGAGIHF